MRMTLEKKRCVDLASTFDKETGDLFSAQLF
jgi:hypothetical protein